MRVIDRIFEFIHHLGISPYAFERKCDLGNGYLKKQSRGKKGSVGSENIEKIVAQYNDLSISWLLTGNGKMLTKNYSPQADTFHSVEEPGISYTSNEQLIGHLKEKVIILENALADKEKIISLLEARLKKE